MALAMESVSAMVFLSLKLRSSSQAFKVASVPMLKASAGRISLKMKKAPSSYRLLSPLNRRANLINSMELLFWGAGNSGE